MIKVALAGLLGRKLRTALTAIAIVLGVAMISGTFVLTDSIDKAFSSIFTDVRKGSTVVVSGKSAFDLSQGQGSFAPTHATSPLLDKVRDVPGVAAVEGSVNGEALLVDQKGKAIVFGGAPNLGFSIANPQSPFNVLRLEAGSWPHGNEVVIGKSTADRKHFHVGDTIGVQAEGPVQKLKISGSSPSARPRLSAARRSQASTCRRPSGSSTSRASWTRSRSPPIRRSPTPRSCDACRRCSRARRRPGSAPFRREGRRRHELVHHVPARLPARLRRDRALRRQLRDRQLALDHDRAANTRARDDAHARREPPAGADVDRRRGARDRRRSRRWSASSSGSASRRGSSASSTWSASPCRTTASRSRRARSSSRSWSACSSR